MSHATGKRGMIDHSPLSVGRFTYGIENITVVGAATKTANYNAALKIGSFCAFAESVTIFLGGHHRTDWATTFPFGRVFPDEFGDFIIKGHPATRGDVIIDDDVWIARGVTIMSGVTIGCGAAIAANAHVVKNVTPYEIVGGNPAKFIKNRFSDEIRDLLLELKWWDLPLDVIKQIMHELSAPPTVAGLKDLIRRYRAEK